MCQDFAREFKINVWLRQGGYLFLARTTRSAARSRRACSVQNECGLAHAHAHAARGAEDRPRARHRRRRRRELQPRRRRRLPVALRVGLRAGGEKLGVEIATFTEVVGIETDRRAHRRGRSPTQRGQDQDATASSTRRARGPPRSRSSLGVELPNKPHRHEICSTEPLKPWLKPLVADLGERPLFQPVDARRDRRRHRPATRARRARSEARSPFLGLYARRSCARARCSAR